MRTVSLVNCILNDSIKLIFCLVIISYPFLLSPQKSNQNQQVGFGCIRNVHANGNVLLYFVLRFNAIQWGAHRIQENATNFTIHILDICVHVWCDDSCSLFVLYVHHSHLEWCSSYIRNKGIWWVDKGNSLVVKKMVYNIRSTLGNNLFIIFILKC